MNITAQIKKKIIATMGSHYSKHIIPYLNEKGVLNAHGKPFSATGIQNIVNGRPSEVVVPHILDLIVIKQREQQKLKEKKSKILKKR